MVADLTILGLSLTAFAFGVAIGAWAARRVRRSQSRVIQPLTPEPGGDELARFSTALLKAQDDERRRIACELHDEVGQALSALKLELTTVGQSLPQDVLKDARAIADRTLQAVRELAQGLHPSMLEDIGLPETADWYVRAFSRRTGIASQLAVQHLDARLAPEVERCTYRVIQEAMTNVARHAGATSCRVEIARRSASLCVTVEDNGRGFRPWATSAPDARGLGLVGMRERVTRLGGHLHVDSAPGSGTRLTIELPLSA